jgi:amino acid adenylation domain-containing protein
MDHGLHERFARQARRTPDAVAVVGTGRSLTYRDLDRQAGRLARRLRFLGVGPGALVGLCLDRTPDLVVGILGILKAGAAYVPLDPAYPPQRLAGILGDARPSLVVTERHFADLLTDFPGRLLFLDDGRDDGPTPDLPAATGEELAYVIFTSGSTGRPKGVPVRHRNVTALFDGTRPLFGFDQTDIWTLFHSAAFDFSVWELWGALLYGGRLVVVPRETSRSPQAFLDLLVSERVTLLNQTPSAFRQLIRAEESRAAPADLALRFVIFGGEALALPALRPWVERHGDERPRLVNMYGITETTVHVTHRRITRADLDGGKGSVIGGPIPGWTVRLLGPDGEPVPDGGAGEIVVGGAGVAAGYLNRPGLTAERFLPGPSGSRVYRSGDLARWLPDGDLEYLGRADHQVKVRGFRIELLEIEAVLCRHPAVRETAAVAREDEPDEKQLVAYVVPADRADLDLRELRAFVRERLPDYMVPATFVVLDRLPTTAHGKVDRGRLPAPAPERPGGPGFVAPATDTERRLQRLWEDVLRVRPVGVRDDFFELGGDSVRAMELSEAVRRAFGRPLDPAALVRGPTVAEMAMTLERPDRPAVLVPLQPRGSRPPFFCVHPLGGQVLGYRVLARHLGDDQPFYGLQARTWDGEPEPFESLEERAARYLAEVRRVRPVGPYHLGGYSLGAMIAFEMARQLARQGHAVALLAAIDDGPSPTDGGAAGAATGILANLPVWLRHQLLRRRWRTVLADVRRKLRVFTRRLGPGRRAPVDLEAVLDVSRYGDAYRQTLANHCRALAAYRPGPYPGRVTLLRARTQALFGPHQFDLGWGRLAAGGVDVRVIPGDHDSIIVEPDVRSLAWELAAALAAAGGQVGEPSRRAA